MFRIALAVLASLSAALFSPGDATAKDGEPAEKIYEGAVGASPVVVALERSGDSVFGRYFYRARRFDIDLSGDVKKGVVQLESNATGDKLSLKPGASGYEGSLTTAKGKTLPVRLRAVGPEAADDSPADAPDELDLYEKMRLAGLTLKPQKLEVVAGKTVRWHVEPVSGVRLFRIDGGYPAPVMAAMNRRLAQIQWANISQYFSCASATGGSGVESLEVEGPYLSDAYVSFAINEAWSCAGAAHPDFSLEGHSFDAHTGKELELDDLLKFGKAPVPKKDSEAWLDYRSKTFAPALVALLKRFHPKEMAPHKDDCDYSDAEVWSFPAWRLTDKGLYVGASFPRAARNCDNPDWPVIPYAALNESGPQR
ncbi:hypothetical protein [Methylocystis sp. S23]